MGNVKRNEFTIIWRIESFSLWCNNPLTGKRTLECTAENLEKSHFYLQLYRKSMEPPVDEKYLSCCLFSYVDDDMCRRHIPMECTMEITDAGGETLQSKRFVTDADKDRILYRWENIMKVNELLNEMRNCTEDTLTVRCHILGEVQARQPKIECEARTEIGVDRCSFVWNVNYSDSSDWSASKNFFLNDAASIHITLSAPEDDVLIDIQFDEITVFFTCRMSLVDVGGHERYSQTANYIFFYDDAVSTFPTFFTKTILKDNIDTFLSSGGFTLACNFSVPNEIDFKEVRYRTLSLVNVPCAVDDVSSLHSDLRDMFTSKKHADVKLRIDNEILPAHKNILAARSPVFSAMFDQDMLESQTGIVDIEDFDVKTMNSFLEFLYTGTVDDLDYENASKLLIAAEKYQVLSLKKKCSSFLMAILSEENACEIIVFADMVGHELLKASSLDYIRSHAGNILRSPQWLKWSEKNFKLATEIFCMLSTDMASVK